eukprot:TRINITY_DN7715_c0_g1_i1.p1 TRINITY_DN7715_c0_g1~~TRINITY_DN7715_c0_g1_i1.p1  ORF type:complete len:788 (-),score=214.01 TRINITY_DN7715_c0_g1_i1:6-2369(-)
MVAFVKDSEGMETEADAESPAAQKQKQKPFPAGLRVLVVDDDPTCLRILDRMLKKCLYKVTTCPRAKAALSLLRENKNGFDLVISDVYMPDLDGFELLERVGLEMDLPVIMMSADGGTSTVMKGIKHGACDYLIKPVRIEELQNIWQHVVRKKRNESKDFDHSGSFEDNDRNKRGSDDIDYASSANEGTDGNWKLVKKRKEAKDEEDDVEPEMEDPSASKKPRVVWSVELHQQFVNAVNQLGIDKAVPKRILELMNVQGLTRENVASHLQKYRLYLKRLSGVTQQQNGMSSSFGRTVDGGMGAMGLLGRIDLPGLAASGQISPQALSSLPAELLGRVNATNCMGIPTVEQSLLLQASLNDAKSNINRRFGNTLVNNQGNVLQGFQSSLEPKQFSAAQQQHISSFANMGSSINEPVVPGFGTLQSPLNMGSNAVGIDQTRLISGHDGLNPQKSTLLMQLIQQRQQSNQFHQQLPASALQQSSFGQSKAACVQNGQLNLTSAGLMGMPAASSDIKNRNSLLSLANCRGTVGNSASVISGSENVNHPPNISYGMVTNDVNVSERVAGISVPGDHKNQSVASISGNECSILNSAGVSSSPSVSVDMEGGRTLPGMKMLVGSNETVSSSSINCSGAGVGTPNDLVQLSTEIGRHSWRGQSIHPTQDASQLTSIVSPQHANVAHGVQGRNALPVQDVTQVKNFTFVAKKPSLQTSFEQNAFPGIKNSQDSSDVLEANIKSRIKEEGAVNFSMNLKNEPLMLSEPFSDDLMNVIFRQHSEASGLMEDDFNLDAF